MKFFLLGSISKKLTLLVLFALLPALTILLYTGMDQRKQSIEDARHDVLLLTKSMAETQKDIAGSVRQVLSTLSLLPEVRGFDIKACRTIIEGVLRLNPDYLNIALTDLNGDVLVSGKPSAGANLADRKHFQEALKKNDFAVGEFIVSRVGTMLPAFAFAYPVPGKNGRPIAVLTTIIKVDRYLHYSDQIALPENSFIAVTDSKGIRLSYYPPKEETNPVGKPIASRSWEIASQAKGAGIFISTGSDGLRRILAFEPIRLTQQEAPYLYVWAGMPEEYILKPANTALKRNMLLMFLVLVLSLLIAWLVGKFTVLNPIQNLVSITQEFSRGNLEARSDYSGLPGELGTLTTAFHEMADALILSRKTLVENEARFRLVMDSLDALIYVADMDTYEILFINEYGRKLFGNVTGKICWQVLQQGQDGPCQFCTNKFLLDENNAIGDEYTWEFQNTQNGHWYYIRDRAITWIDDRIVRLEIATDISERKQTEVKLAEEKERLAVTLRSIGDGVITTDTRGRVVLINNVAEHLTGWSGEDASGRPLSEIFTLINRETKLPEETPVEIILASGNITGLTSNTILVSKDGQERNVADSGAPIRDKTGNIIGVVLVFRDITEQLRNEQELGKVRKLESIGVLAGGIAHDFNNILTAILGNLDLSLLDSTLTDKTQALLNEAINASHRARDLTQQLLTFAKGGEPIKEAASLQEIVKDSADFILRGNKVSCHYLFSNDLWLVDIDKGQISQVVQNIILNATNAMPDGGTIEVSCQNVDPDTPGNPSLAQGSKFVQLRIQDTGIGMPAKVLNKIFDPYFSTKQDGSGLGLAITHSIIMKHGGYIAAESSPGVGTTFTIYLPATGRSLIAEKIEEVITLQHIRKMHILVMDDDKQVRDISRAMLKQLGHDVVLACGGEEALQLYKEAMDSGNLIDLVIMDLTIPGGMGGKEAVQDILSIDPEARVIVSSGYSNNPAMAHFEKYGFCAAIAKPFQLRELKKVIDKLAG